MAHKILELREDYLHIVDFGTPFGIPFKRDKSVVIYRTEREDTFTDRELPLAHKAEARFVFDDLGILYVNVLDISTEVLDRGLGCFLGNEICRIHIPKCGNVIARKAVEQVAKHLCVGKKPRCL